MQLKIKRSQRDSGLVSKTVVFCLDARVHMTATEAGHVRRYKLHNQVIYNSEASKQLLERSSGQNDGTFAGGLKSLASVAMAATKLNLTIGDLEQGKHIECKSLDELVGAEEAIMEACTSLRRYLDTAATFDGREVLFDFQTDEPKLVAQAVSPQPMLIQEARVAPAGAAAREALPAPTLRAEGTRDAPMFAQPRARPQKTGDLATDLSPEAKLYIISAAVIVLLILMVLILSRPAA